MATADAVKDKIQSLIDAANAVTGHTDADMTTAVTALIAGFGSEGGSENSGNSGTPFYSGTYYTAERLAGETITFSIPGEVSNFVIYLNDSPDLETGKAFMTSVIGSKEGGYVIAAGSTNTGSNATASSCFALGGNSGYYYGIFFEDGAVSLKPSTVSTYARAPLAGKNYAWIAW